MGYLIKMVGETKAGRAQSLPKAVRYLADAPMDPVNTGSLRGHVATQIALLRDRARRIAFDLEADFSEALQSGIGFDDALNSVAVLGYHACECHCMCVMAENMSQALNNDEYMKDASVQS